MLKKHGFKPPHCRMKVFRSFEESKGIKNPVVTTGSFDGVHIGHKTILRRLKMLAEKYNFDAEEIPEQEVRHETVSSTKIRQAISEGYIQRANAYLDHYYIILGKPERFTANYAVTLPPFLKVPLTEESKLLPAHGIYAVSVEYKGIISKGMVLIHNNADDEDEVLVHIFENEDIYKGQTSILYFHKKIHGSVRLEDSRTTFRLNGAKEEIQGLIY